MADMDKIEYIVGGIDDDIVPDNQVEEEYEEESVDTTRSDLMTKDLLSREGITDIPNDIPESERQFYFQAKVRFTMEANSDPLGGVKPLQDRTLLSLFNNGVVPPGFSLNSSSPIVNETVQKWERWTQRWYNTDPNFQQKKAEAQAGANSAADLNYQVRQNNKDSATRQVALRQEVSLYYSQTYKIDPSASTLGSNSIIGFFESKEKKRERAKRMTISEFRDRNQEFYEVFSMPLAAYLDSIEESLLRTAGYYD